MAENRKHMVTIALMTIIASKVHGGYIVSNPDFWWSWSPPESMTELLECQRDDLHEYIHKSGRWG